VVSFCCQEQQKTQNLETQLPTLPSTTAKATGKKLVAENRGFGAAKRSFLRHKAAANSVWESIAMCLPTLLHPSSPTYCWRQDVAQRDFQSIHSTFLFPHNSSIYRANDWWGFLLIRETSKTGLKRPVSSGCVPAPPTHLLSVQEPRAAHPMPHPKPQHDSKSSAETSTLTLAFV